MSSVTNIDTDLSLQMLSTTRPTAESEDQSTTSDSDQEAEEWGSLIRTELQAMFSGKAPHPNCLKAPRRKHADPTSAALAVRIASLVYPAPSDAGLSHVIKYERDIVLLRKGINANPRMEEEIRVIQKEEPTWKERILKQGLWDKVNDPLSHAGAPSLPMPVEISD